MEQMTHIDYAYKQVDHFKKGFPSCSDDKESACQFRRPTSIPGWEDLLEKGMATQASILAWRILQTEEPADYSH